MARPEPTPEEAAKLADLYAVFSMQVTGEWPLRVAEAIAERADARDEAREARPDDA